MLKLSLPIYDSFTMYVFDKFPSTLQVTKLVKKVV